MELDVKNIKLSISSDGTVAVVADLTRGDNVLATLYNGLGTTLKVIPLPGQADVPRDSAECWQWIARVSGTPRYAIEAMAWDRIRSHADAALKISNVMRSVPTTVVDDRLAWKYREGRRAEDSL